MSEIKSDCSHNVSLMRTIKLLKNNGDTIIYYTTQKACVLLKRAISVRFDLC